MFCMSLMKPENRTRFKADERAYLDGWPMSEEQKRAVLDRDYSRMISLGGNIYFLAKLFATDGKSFQYVAAQMAGMSQADYANMMRSEEHTSELQSLTNLVCRLLLEKKNMKGSRMKIKLLSVVIILS